MDENWISSEIHIEFVKKLRDLALDFPKKKNRKYRRMRINS